VLKAKEQEKKDSDNLPMSESGIYIDTPKTWNFWEIKTKAFLRHNGPLK
jgi:hypothetical protein